MTKAKHTPGPWIAYLNIAPGNRSFGIVTDDPNLNDEDSVALPHYHPLVANVLRGHGHAPREIAEANARLIADAPDMYDLLSEALPYLVKAAPGELTLRIIKILEGK